MTTLLPFPRGGFRDALVEGLRRAQADGDRPSVRILAGAPPSWDITYSAAKAFRDEVITWSARRERPRA